MYVVVKTSANMRRGILASRDLKLVIRDEATDYLPCVNEI